MSRRSKALALFGAIMLPCLLAVVSGQAASAAQQSGAGGSSSAISYASINGSGSTWAQNAVNQWIANINQFQVVFSGDGSAAGRTDFALGTYDFAISDIGYQGKDPVTGQQDSSSRPYAYLPVTAGGTSFPYNLVVNGKRITNLRLSGQTLAEIFTKHITNWDSPAIATDMHMKQPFPSLPITTVVESEGSGTSFQFSNYLSVMFPQYWGPFDGGHNVPTEYWPSGASGQVAQSNSSQVINFISSNAANGSIGYDEYSYALQAGFPVAQVENAAHYFVLPSEYNDAVALTTAQINTDPRSSNYLLQTLNKVYTNPDRRAYPLSSYSYSIIPTSKTDELMKDSGSPGFPAKAQSLASFLDYSICQGQEYIGPIGYSALPVNLVEAGFQQIERIKAAAPGISLAQLDISNCHNPTFDSSNLKLNQLAQEAPYPPSCDEAGQGPCSGVLNANANAGKGSSNKNGSGGTPNPSSSASSSASASSSSSTSSGGSTSGGSTSGSTNTGSGTTASDTGSNGGTGPATNVASDLPAGQNNGLNNWALGALVVLLLLAILIIPPIVSRGMSGRGRQW